MKTIHLPFDTMKQVYALLNDLPAKHVRPVLNAIDQQMTVTVEEEMPPVPAPGSEPPVTE